MLDKTQVTKVAVAGFGAAMASVFAIPEAHATIIPLSFNPGSVPASSIKTVGVKVGSGSGTLFSLGVSNLSTGKRLSATNSLGTYIDIKPNGATISGGMFSGTVSVFNSGSAAGTEYIGFRDPSGGAGWFAVNWGGSGGAIQFLRGAFNTDEGGSIVVGQMPGGGVPEPSELGLMALGLLALGAAGVRLRREARKAAELN